MKYWIYRDGLQRGPFTIEELADMNLTPDTPVWYEGLDNWITAAESPGLAPLLGTRQNGGPADGRACDVEYTEVDCETAVDTSSAAASDTTASQAYAPQSAAASSMPQGECPSTYLAWSIICTICCCMPLGIAAIIYSGKVKPRWQRGDARGAAKASETAQILIILAITLSVFSLPFSFLL